MNNQISNPKREVPKGMKLNDKDYLDDLLSCLKSMEKDFSFALTEASNEFLYDEYYNMFNDISQLQRAVYELMFKMGWYTVEKADSAKINSKYQMLSTELQDLNG